MDDQIVQLNSRISELKEAVKSDNEKAVAQTRAVNGLEATNQALNLQIDEYKTAVAKLEKKIKDAYDGIQKQNDAIKTLTSQRDEFVQKLNDTVKDRNNIVEKYNELAARYEKLQSDGEKLEVSLRALLPLVACADSFIDWIASLSPSPQPSPRGEGEPFFSFRASPSVRDCNHGGMTILPLPKGEGRGEGEGNARLPKVQISNTSYRR